jgi:hypothetical protein
MRTLKWFKLIAEPDNREDDIPAHIELSIDPQYGGTTYFDSFNEALEWLLKNDYLQ